MFRQFFPRLSVSPNALAGLLVATAATGAAAAPAVASEAGAVRPTQQLVGLLKAHTLVSAPHARPSAVGRVGAVRPLTGGQTVLPVIGRTRTKDGGRWLRVLVPGRPNGRKAWIAKRATELTKTSWRVVVRTSQRKVRVYRRGHRVRTFEAIVGTPWTPTPHGRFFVEEGVRMSSTAVGGPFALALSARSNVLQEFEGGPGQIAMHGVANLGGTMGTAASHGCVRLTNRSITWLAARLGAGVPVTIKP